VDRRSAGTLVVAVVEEEEDGGMDIMNTRWSTRCAIFYICNIEYYYVAEDIIEAGHNIIVKSVVMFGFWAVLVSHR
jgi:hypothetical protein